MESSRYVYAPDVVSPPGRSLKRALDAIGMTQTELAARLGKTEKFVSELINGKATIAPETAIHLERVIGTPASYWNRREATYRAWLAQMQEKQELQAQENWAASFPIRQMRSLGFIGKAGSSSGLTQQLLEYFGIATPNEWEAVWGKSLPVVGFRKSAHQEVDRPALSAWLRYGEIRSLRIACPDYSKAKFEQVLLQARRLTVEPPEVFQPALVELCRTAGVALVFTPDLPKTRVLAATRWRTPRKALIQIGLRYKTDDQLWFSFFHEAVHVLEHSKKALFLKCGELDDAAEAEADSVAANFLIPKKKYVAFCSTGRFSKVKIAAFAEEIGIAPGIIVGRLQHDGLLLHSHCNDLKRRYFWKVES